MTVPLTLRYMTLRDIPQVLPIEEAAFAFPWPPASFVYEISDSNCSYMVVLESHHERPARGVQHWFDRWRGVETFVQEPYLVGIGGMWCIQDEAHISTIATDTHQRGKGYGELMLAGMLAKSVWLRAEFVVLEVRVDNQVAQNLYLKYGFRITQLKKNYYQRERADAYEMRLDLTPATRDMLQAAYQRLQTDTPFTDNYSYQSPPRRG